MNRDDVKTESAEVRTTRVFVTLLATLGGMVLVAFGFMFVFPDRIGMTFVDKHPFPAPAVTADEVTQRERAESHAHATLEGRGGRMPIEDAMRVIAAKGPHAFDPIENFP